MPNNTSQLNALHQTSSEVNTLAARGFRLISKLGEGTYAKVYLGEYRCGKARKHATDGADADSSTSSSTEAAASAAVAAGGPHAPPTSPTAVTTLACKVIDTARVTQTFATKFLPRELDVLVRISHPHIIHVHSIFQRRTKYYIFMRYAENGDLHDYILRDGAIPEPQTRFWARQVSLALQYLHRMQIAHRDLKCENVLVTVNNNVKLCDFGFARYVVDAQSRRQLSETFCGSLAFAAPEILKGVPYAPKCSDMWAFGVLVFTMLNQAMPFAETQALQLHESQMRRRWKFSHRVVEHLSSEVKSMVKRLLEPNVKKRLRIDDVIAHQWFEMDTRLKVLNNFELAALMAADKARPGSVLITNPPGGSIVVEQTQAIVDKALPSSAPNSQPPAGPTPQTTRQYQSIVGTPRPPKPETVVDLPGKIEPNAEHRRNNGGSFLKPIIAKFNRSNTPKPVN